MALPSKGELDRAGRRLRESESPSDEDLALYNAYRTSFEPHLWSLVETIASAISDIAEISVDTRLKQPKSVIAKLRRHQTKLSTIEDIGGCRIFAETMLDARSIVDALSGSLDIVRQRDYWEGPRDGYRASHLIAQLSERHRVEIQVRTEIQNEWANLSEYLSHRVDPEVKYGGGPPTLRSDLDRLSWKGAELDEFRAALADLVAGSSALQRQVMAAESGSDLPGADASGYLAEARRRLDAVFHRQRELNTLLRLMLVDFTQQVRKVAQPARSHRRRVDAMDNATDSPIDDAVEGSMDDATEGSTDDAMDDLMDDAALEHFLVRFNLEAYSPQPQVVVYKAGDVNEALKALHTAESSGGGAWETVLFLADSLDTVKTTHRSYFATSAPVLTQPRSLDPSTVETFRSTLNEINAEHLQIERLLEQIT